MLLRRLGAQFSRAPSTGTIIRSTSILSPQAVIKPPSFHRDATHQHGLLAVETRLDLSRPYYNYAPRDQQPHYDVYGPPPKSRGGRLKDMAIGSALTIWVFMTYVTYVCRDYIEPLIEKRLRDEQFKKIHGHYSQLWEEIRASDENSAEILEKQRLLNKERAIAIARAFQPEGEDVLELGPLPWLPADYAHRRHIEQTIEEEDTVILLSRISPSVEARTGARYEVTLGINAFEEDIMADAVEDGIIISAHPPKVREFLVRLHYKLRALKDGGTIDGNVVGTLVLWNARYNIACKHGVTMLLRV